GAGVMIQIPDEFLRAVVDFKLPPAGAYATGLAFLPTDAGDAARAKLVLEKFALVEGAHVLGWREMPTDAVDLGATARAAMPRIAQVFLAAERLDAPGTVLTGLDLDRVVYCVRKQTERETSQRGIELYL